MRRVSGYPAVRAGRFSRPGVFDGNAAPTRPLLEAHAPRHLHSPVRLAAGMSPVEPDGCDRRHEPERIAALLWRRSSRAVGQRAPSRDGPRHGASLVGAGPPGGWPDRQRVKGVVTGRVRATPLERTRQFRAGDGAQSCRPAARALAWRQPGTIAQVPTTWRRPTQAMMAQCRRSARSRSKESSSVWS